MIQVSSISLFFHFFFLSPTLCFPPSPLFYLLLWLSGGAGEKQCWWGAGWTHFTGDGFACWSELLMGHMNTQGSHLIAMASQISSYGLGAFMSRKGLSILIYPKQTFSPTPDWVSQKVVPQAVLNVTIYNSSDTLICKFFRMLFWLQVLDSCLPAVIAQKLPKAAFYRYKIIWISFQTFSKEVIQHISSEKQVLFLWLFLYRHLSTFIHIWFVFLKKKKIKQFKCTF